MSEPVAWIRYCSDGSYEGPIVDSMMEDLRKESGAWTPLFERDAARERLREDTFSAGMTRAVDIAKVIAESESEEGNDSYGVGWQIADRILKARNGE